MDEVTFRFSQHMNAFQVHLHSAAQSGRIHFQAWIEKLHEYLQHFLSSPRGIQLQEDYVHVKQWLGTVMHNAKHHLKSAAGIKELYHRLLQILKNEFTRTSLYCGCIGFVLGGITGLAIAAMFRKPTVQLQRMKAVICNNYRGLDSLCMTDEARVPIISSSDEVLVQVKAASIDVLDVKICSGYGQVLRRHLNKYNNNYQGNFPITLGRDGSGVIVGVGKNVTRFRPGDEVWWAVPFWASGTMSELIVVKECQLARKPEAIGFESAAAIPYSGCIAWNAIFHQAKLNVNNSRGKRILIHMGCSPVGLILLQLAKLWGAHVTVTCSIRSSQICEALGADDIILFTKDDVEKQLELREKFYVIFNTVGQTVHDNLLQFCEPDGSVVTTVNSYPASDKYGFVIGSLFALMIRIKFFIKSLFGSCTYSSVKISPEVLDQLAILVELGSIQPVVDKIFSPQDAELAFHHAISSESFGKTIIRFRWEDRCTCGAFVFGTSERRGFYF